MELGLLERDFWHSTPRQIARTFRAHDRRLQREHNERAWLAWHIGALQRATKRYPTLESLLIKQRPKPQTWQQQLAVAQMWTAQRHGKITRRVN